MNYNFKLGGLFTEGIDFNSNTQLNWIASNMNSITFIPSVGVASAFKYIKQLNSNFKGYIYLESGIAGDSPDNVGKYIGVGSGIATYCKTNIINYPTTSIPVDAPIYTRYMDFGAPTYINYWYTRANYLIGSSFADGVVINEPIWNKQYYVNQSNPTTITASYWNSISQGSYTYNTGYAGINGYNNFIRSAASYIPTYDVILKSDTLLSKVDTVLGLSNNTVYDLIDTTNIGIYNKNTIYSNGTYNTSTTSKLYKKISEDKLNSIYFNDYEPYSISTTNINYAIDNQLLISNPTSSVYLKVGSYNLNTFINIVGSYPNQFNNNIGTISSETKELESNLFYRDFSIKDVYVNLSSATKTYTIPTGIALRDHINLDIAGDLTLSPYTSELLSVSSGIVIDYDSVFYITEFAQGLKTNVNEVILDSTNHVHTDNGEPNFINLASHTTGILDSSSINTIDISRVASVIVNWNQLPVISHIGRVNEYCTVYREQLNPDVNSNYTKYYASKTWLSSDNVLIFKNGTIIDNYVASPANGYIVFADGINTWSDQLTIAFDTKTWIANKGKWNADAGVKIKVNNSDYTHLIDSVIPSEGKIIFKNNIDFSAYVKITLFNQIVRDIGSYSHYELEDKISGYDSYMPFQISNVLQSNLLNNIILSTPSHNIKNDINTYTYDMLDMYQDEVSGGDGGITDGVPGPIDIVPTIGTYSYAIASQALGQTFASNYTTLNGIRTYLQRTGTTAYNINFKLYENNLLGLPSILLATTSIGATHIPTFGSWYDFTIPSTNTTLNNMYSVTIDTTLASTANSRLHWYDNSVGYDFGNAIIYEGSWRPLYDTDRTFDTIYSVPSLGRGSGISATGALGQVFVSQTDYINRVGIRANKDGTASYRIKLSILDVNATRLPVSSISYGYAYSGSNYINTNATYSGYAEFVFTPPLKINSGKEYCLSLTSEATSNADLVYWNNGISLSPLDTFAIASSNYTWGIDTTKDRSYFYYPCDNDLQIPLFRFIPAEVCIFKFNKVNKISIYMKRYAKERENISAVAVNYSVRVSICDLDSSNNPSTVKYSKTIDSNLISDAGYYDFTFTNAYVTPKKKYAVKIEQIGGDIDNTIIVYSIDRLVSLWNNTLVYLDTTWQALNNSSIKMIPHCFDNSETIDDANENYGLVPTYYALTASTSVVQTFRHTAVSPTQMHLSVWMKTPTAMTYPTYIVSNILSLTAGVPNIIVATAQATVAGMSTYSFQPVDFYYSVPSIAVGTYAFQIAYPTNTVVPSIQSYVGINLGYNANYTTYWKNSSYTVIPSYTVPFEMHSIGSFVDDDGGSDSPIENGIETVVTTVGQTFVNDKTNITKLKVFLSKDTTEEFTYTIKLVNCDGSNLPLLTSVLYEKTLHSLTVSDSGDYVTLDFSDYPIPVNINSYYAIIITKDTSGSNLYWWKSSDFPIGVSYQLINSIWTADTFDRSFLYYGQGEITDPNRKSLPSNIVSNDLVGVWNSAKVTVSLVIDQSGTMTSNDPGKLRFSAAKNFINSMNSMLGNSAYFDLLLFTLPCIIPNDFNAPGGYVPKIYSESQVNITPGPDPDNLGRGYQVVAAMLGDTTEISNDAYLLTEYIEYIKNTTIGMHGTSLYSSIDVAIDRLNSDTVSGLNSEKIIILFTDGMDSSQYTKFSTLIDKIKANNIPIYIIALPVQPDINIEIPMDARLRAQAEVFNAITTASNGKSFLIPDIDKLSDVFTYIKESGSWTYQDYEQIQDFGEDVSVTSVKVETIVNDSINMFYTIDYRTEAVNEWTSYQNGKSIYCNPLSDTDEIVNFVARYIRYNIHFNSGGSQNVR